MDVEQLVQRAMVRAAYEGTIALDAARRLGILATKLGIERDTWRQRTAEAVVRQASLERELRNVSSDIAFERRETIYWRNAFQNMVRERDQFKRERDALSAENQRLRKRVWQLESDNYPDNYDDDIPF